MREEQYIRFLREVYVKTNGKHLKESSILKYSKQTTSKINKYLKKLLPDSSYSSIYDVNSIEELKEIRDLLTADPEFIRDNNVGDNMYSNGLSRYIEFAEGSLILKYSNDTSILDIKEPIPETIETKPRTLPARDSLKIAQAKGACKYCCQIDKTHKSFISEKTKTNYVEGHHIIPISCQQYFAYSLDVLANIIILCPNCHRFFHYAIKPDRIDRLCKIYDERYDRFNNAGILTDRQTFVNMAIGDEK